MSVLSGQTLWSIRPLEPMVERQRHEETGTSFGVSMCGYDIRLDQDIWLPPGRTVLASSLERFTMPLDVVGIVHDKSTWARRGVSVQNTVIEPGWSGYLTLELLYSPLITNDEQAVLGSSVDRLYPGSEQSVMILPAGTPIAQVLFHRVDEETEGYGDGKYANQERGPQEAR